MPAILLDGKRGNYSLRQKHTHTHKRMPWFQSHIWNLIFLVAFVFFCYASHWLETHWIQLANYSETFVLSMSTFQPPSLHLSLPPCLTHPKKKGGSQASFSFCCNPLIVPPGMWALALFSSRAHVLRSIVECWKGIVRLSLQKVFRVRGTVLSQDSS